MKVKLIFVLLFLSVGINSNFTIVGPKDLQDHFRREIQFKIANFGKVPYGSSIQGKLYYSHNETQQQIGCDDSKMAPYLYADGNPGFILIDNGNCTYAKKAKNVENIGGNVMIVISNEDNVYDDQENYDDGTGDSINIPTIILGKRDGEILRKYSLGISSMAHAPVINFKFNQKVVKVAKVDYYLSSHDYKSLKFLVDFEKYMEKLGDKIELKVIYKSYKCWWCNPSKGLTNDNCIDDGNFCGSTDDNLKITDGKITLKENIRQSCIFQNSTSSFFKYINRFTDICADIAEPNFNEECSRKALKDIKLDSNTKIEECYQNTLNSPQSSFLKNDLDNYKKNRVFIFPQVRINGEIYKGSLLAKNVFNNVCSTLSDKKICSQIQELNKDTKSALSWGTIIFIVFLIIIVNIIFIYCYRRIVNQNLDRSIDEKIQSQAVFSLSQYKVFQDEIPSNKKVLVSHD